MRETALVTIRNTQIVDTGILPLIQLQLDCRVASEFGRLPVTTRNIIGHAVRDQCQIVQFTIPMGERRPIRDKDVRVC